MAHTVKGIFDAADHKILIQRWVGLSGAVLERFKSYLRNRAFLVPLGDQLLKERGLWSTTGVSFRAFAFLFVHVTCR